MPDVGQATCEIGLVSLLRMPADQAGEAVGGQVELRCDPWTHTDITELAGSPELCDLVDGEHAVLAVLGGQERGRSTHSEWAYHAPVLSQVITAALTFLGCVLITLSRVRMWYGASWIDCLTFMSK